MAALAADTSRVIFGNKTYSFKIKDATQLYVGSFASVDSTGYLIPFGGAAGEKLIGRTLPTPAADTGDGSGALLGKTAANPVREATVCMEGEVLYNVSVTGVSAITNLKSVVFLNSNDNDLTLTRPARGMPFGTVVRWYSSTKCDVMRFSAEALDVISLGGNGSSAMIIFSGQAADVASATYNVPSPPGAFKLRSFQASVIKALAGGTSITLQSKISATNTTGGLLTLNTTGGTGGTAGDDVAATAITALNAGSESDTLKLVATVTGTFTAGSFYVFAIFDNQIGL